MKPKKSKKYPLEQVAFRYFLLVTAFATLAVVIFTRAAFLMFGETHDYWMEVSKQFKKNHIEIPAKRGNIISADGQVLATTLPEYRMYMDFMSWETDSVNRMRDQLRRDRLLYLKMDSICEGMHRLFPDINPEEFRKHLLAGRAKKSHHWPLYKPRVTYIQYRKVKEIPLFRLSQNSGGFHVEKYLKRKTPFGALAHATVGLYDEERDDKHTHKALMTGLEQSFDSVLRGTPGVAHREKVMSRYIEKVDTFAQDGCDIVTTLNVSMQDLVEKVLGDQLKSLDAEVGMCILMEVETGDVKAISSLTRVREGVYREVDNRALYSRREPGSVFKPMSFMVAFDDKKIDLNDGFNVGGGVREMYGRKMRDSDWRKGGRNRWISAVECIKYSSNVGVSALIDAAYRSHPEKFVEGLDRIGIRTDLKLPFREYMPPVIRYPKKDKHGHWMKSAPNLPAWSNTALPWMSIGYETQIPPIQTLTFYNAVANGGKMVKPRFVKAIMRGTEVVQEFPVEYIHANRPDKMMCSKDALKKVQTCLEAVVQKYDCTGKDVYTKSFPIAGKTGTAQIWEKGGNSGKYIISFAGYFPANKPQYSMIVCIEKPFPAYGGSMCGPVFKKIAETIWARNFRADPRSARDTTATRDHLPVMRGGNLHALGNVLDELNVGYTRNYDKNEGLVWGRNTSETPQSALLTSDGHNQTKKSETLTMPDVRGYGLRDAVYRLERMGLKVRTSGHGRVVRQSIAAGKAVRRRDVVDIVLSTDEKYKDPEPAPVKPDSAHKDSAKTTEVAKPATEPAKPATAPAHH